MFGLGVHRMLAIWFKAIASKGHGQSRRLSQLWAIPVLHPVNDQHTEPFEGRALTVQCGKDGLAAAMSEPCLRKSVLCRSNVSIKNMHPWITYWYIYVCFQRWWVSRRVHNYLVVTYSWDQTSRWLCLEVSFVGKSFRRMHVCVNLGIDVQCLREARFHFVHGIFKVLRGRLCMLQECIRCHLWASHCTFTMVGLYLLCRNLDGIVMLSWAGLWQKAILAIY